LRAATALQDVPEEVMPAVAEAAYALDQEARAAGMHHRRTFTRGSVGVDREDRHGLPLLTGRQRASGRSTGLT
jgi:hypothetical protein